MTLDTADHLRDASPWRAEPNPVFLAILGKLGEELGELQAAVSRCIIQGVYSSHPVDGKQNLDWLFEEIADVINMINYARKYWQHDLQMLEARIDRKRLHIQQWLEQVS